MTILEDKSGHIPLDRTYGDLLSRDLVEFIWVMIENYSETTNEYIEGYIGSYWETATDRLSREDYEKFLAEEGDEYVERRRAYFEGLSEEEWDLYESRLAEHPAVQAYYETLWFEVYEAEVELAAETEGEARRPFHEKQEPYPGKGKVAEQAEYGEVLIAHFGRNKKTNEIIKKPVVFRGTDADVQAIEPLLDEIPPWLAYSSMSGAILWARPELILRLYQWREEIFKICKDKDPENARRIKFPVNSSYRVLGTTACTPSHPFYDPKGVKDSTDEWGHWTGLSVDIDPDVVAAKCVPPLTRGDIYNAAKNAGLVWPIVGERWHFRPSPEYMP
jgi:hypothetical protein